MVDPDLARRVREHVRSMKPGDSFTLDLPAYDGSGDRKATLHIMHMAGFGILSPSGYRITVTPSSARIVRLDTAEVAA